MMVIQGYGGRYGMVVLAESSWHGNVARLASALEVMNLTSMMLGYNGLLKGVRIVEAVTAETKSSGGRIQKSTEVV